MRAVVIAMGLAVCGAAGCGGCDSSKDGPVKRAEGGPPPSALLAPKPPKPACVAMGVVGDTGGAANGKPIPDGWLTLAAGARFTAKDPRTTRETTFDGEGRARACVGREEESWITQGTFHATAGAGESPMQEEWVATPMGVVRYAQAELVTRVETPSAWEGGQVEIAMTKGAAFFYAPDMAPQELAARQADDGGWYALKLGEKLALHPAKRKEGNDDWAKHIATVCEEDARQAHGVARAIADGGAAKLGDLAKQHVLMRRRARASCATAMVLASMVESALRTELEARLHAADADWRSLY